MKTYIVEYTDEHQIGNQVSTETVMAPDLGTAWELFESEYPMRWIDSVYEAGYAYGLDD